MDIKFDKNSAGNEQNATDGKGKQNALLIVLLVLVGAFAYIYFFTGLIKPVQEQKPAAAPAVSQVAKKPLPSPDGTPAKPEAAAEVKKEAPAAPAAKPEPAPAAAPAPAAVAKPKEEPKKSDDDMQTAVKKPLPGAVKPAVKVPAPPEKKEPAAVASKPQPPKEVEKKVVAVPKPVEKKQAAEAPKPVEKKPAAPAAAVAKAKADVKKPVDKETAAPAKITGTGPWTVLVGNYVLEEALANDLARVRKAGLEATVVPGALKKTHMNRLLLAEYTDRDSAQAELAKLKKHTADAFIIDSAGMHSVYAGSYLLDARAASEKERLAAAGFNLTLKRVDVSIPTKNLTAGSFADKGAAEEALKKIRAVDVKATVPR